MKILFKITTKCHCAESLRLQIGEEKRLNPRLTKSEEEFVGIMDNLKLDYPKQIGRSAFSSGLRDHEGIE